MPLSPAQSLQLNQFLDSKVRWKLGPTGRTQFLGVLSCGDAAQLLYDVFIIHQAHITISRGAKHRVDTDDSGDITINLRSISEDPDDTLIDCVVFEACNSKAQKITPRNLLMARYRFGGVNGTRCGEVGTKTAGWEAANMLQYVKMATQIPQRYRTNNMKKAIVKWENTGRRDGIFVDQQVKEPHDSKMVTLDGVPTGRMGLPTRVLYSYEYICKRTGHTTFANDVFYAAFNFAHGGLPARFSGASKKYEKNSRLPRGISYTNEQTEQCIRLGDWIYMHWPKGAPGQSKPERVLFVHDTVRSCRTNPALNAFSNVQAADFGLDSHTEAIAFGESTDKTRHSV